jgi:exopolyphosphatase/guanosine-5'-triphosphate,3'-diphosphate pyrophosphatase
MRVGQRLSGGVASVLERTRLNAGYGVIQLVVPRGEESLAGDAVERRFVRLAELLGCEPAIASV